MEKGILNMYDLYNKTILSKKYERCLLINKYYKKDSRTPQSYKLNIRLKHWCLRRHESISYQTAVCRRGGGFKRVINLLGFDRHLTRQLLNTKKIPILKKMSW
jgi:ribosomal protein S14